MSIPKALENIKGIEVFLVAALCVSLLAAGWGVFVLKNEATRHTRPFVAVSTVYVPMRPGSIAPPFTIVGSKTGKKYYASTCAAAKRIKPEKLLIFKNRAEAEAKKYLPAANCPDLEENGGG